MHSDNDYYPFPAEKVLGFLKNESVFAVLETTLCDDENFRSFVSFGLLEKRETDCPKRLDKLFAWAGRMSDLGHYVICAIPYEAGVAMEQSLHLVTEKLPLPATFYIFKHNVIFDHRTGCFSKKFLPEVLPGRISRLWRMKELWFDVGYDEYRRNVQKIKQLIRSGETYQVNYTMRCGFTYTGSIYGLYLDLRAMQPVPYSAFIKDGCSFILSFSPELFFRRTGRQIKVRPMKGTIARGANDRHDTSNAEALRASIKDRAENIMIVDMMRNDLGRICGFGSVIADPLFKVEKYRTLFQMTSTVSGTLNRGVALPAIFRALFPSGSVTGAPKIRTMQIISELEKNPRGIYTGAIGAVLPGGDAVFNVAIRTIQIKGKTGEMGTGSGIVYDSKPEKEYRECLLKSVFLASASKKLMLIETIRWVYPDGYFLLDLHLKRLQRSAEFFRFTFRKKYILGRLEEIAKSFDKKKIYRVRLLLAMDGNISIQPQKVTAENPRMATAGFYGTKTNPDNIFLYHKTTIRETYNRAYQWALRCGYFDAIFENNRGEVTEGAITNIFVMRNGVLYTPPVSCGLLPGVLRQHLLMQGKTQEKILTRKDLLSAEKIFLGNSVRGLVEVHIA
jgi:para-aminobenzoate synthetase/4-amino-4-deoxychorismate lyase